MKLPKTVKIGGHNYKIDFPYIFKERSDSYAQHRFATKEIKVESITDGVERPESGIMVSFIHEILHAIDYTTGHRIFADNENTIEGFSESIYQILVDNGWLKEE